MAWGPAWRDGGEIQSGRKTAGGRAAHREVECQEEWECWGERAPTPPGPGELEAAVGAGGSEHGLGHLCRGGVEG